MRAAGCGTEYLFDDTGGGRDADWPVLQVEAGIALSEFVWSSWPTIRSRSADPVFPPLAFQQREAVTQRSLNYSMP